MTSTFLLPQHIIPLDFDTTFPAVPESHVWPESGEVPFDTRHQLASIPTVDLTNQCAVKCIGDACQTWAVFQVTGHGVPVTLLEDVEREARRLFSLPMERKMRALRSGATGYGLPRISPLFPKSMWCEGFTIMGSPLEDARKLWPKDHKRFCEVMEEYQSKMKQLAEKLLLPLILQSLGIAKEDLDSLCRISDPVDRRPGRPPAALQLNSYPSCPEPWRVMGLAAHTDTSLFTIIHQSGGDGLQIFAGEGAGSWATVAPVSCGALIVNLGDFFHILSNGRFKAVLHRAVVNEARRRLSVAYFCGLPPNAQVQPFPKIVEEDGKEFPTGRYRPVTVREYISIKDKNLYKALSLIRT